MNLSSDTTLTPSTAAGTPGGWPPPPVTVPSHAGTNSWLGWTAATVASIWASVAIISVFAPDMISGSEQQRMPIAAFTTWLWGLGGSVASLVPMARLRTDVGRRAFWIMLSGATMAIWAVAMLVSVFGPTMVTGSDPTTIPLAAMIAPVVAMLATVAAGIVAVVANGLSRPPRSIW